MSHQTILYLSPSVQNNLSEFGTVNPDYLTDKKNLSGSHQSTDFCLDTEAAHGPRKSPEHMGQESRSLVLTMRDSGKGWDSAGGSLWLAFEVYRSVGQEDSCVDLLREMLLFSARETVMTVSLAPWPARNRKLSLAMQSKAFCLKGRQWTKQRMPKEEGCIVVCFTRILVWDMALLTLVKATNDF